VKAATAWVPIVLINTKAYKDVQTTFHMISRVQNTARYNGAKHALNVGFNGI